KDRDEKRGHPLDGVDLGDFVKIWGKRKTEKWSSLDWIKTRDNKLVVADVLEMDTDPLAFVYMEISRWDYKNKMMSRTCNVY
ncbi:unnamed protein product, partial [Amoebophrya sp. A25]